MSFLLRFLLLIVNKMTANLTSPSLSSYLESDMAVPSNAPAFWRPDGAWEGSGAIPPPMVSPLTPAFAIAYAKYVHALEKMDRCTCQPCSVNVILAIGTYRSVTTVGV